MNDQDGHEDSLRRARDDVELALQENAGSRQPIVRVVQACLDLLPVDGASVSVAGSGHNRQLLYASDDVSRKLELLQFSLGEGPCFESFTTRGPVLVPDLVATDVARWPAFAAEVAGFGVGAMFSFPLIKGAIGSGSLDLYRRLPGWLEPEQVTIALRIVDVASMVLLNLRTAPAELIQVGDLLGDEARAQVHQAVGMLTAAYGTSSENALARLRAHAFATGQMIDGVAGDIVDRRLAPADLDI